MLCVKHPSRKAWSVVYFPTQAVRAISLVALDPFTLPSRHTYVAKGQVQL